MVSCEIRWLRPVASTMASISGRMIEYSPVSSNMITTAVIGARAEPAKTAPMPTRANAPTDPTSGLIMVTISPNAAPSMAPQNRLGAKTPPEPPMPMVRLQAMTFPISKTTKNPSAYVPATALPSTGYPTPYIWGRTNNTAPSSTPPTPGRSHSGPRHAQSHASSIRYRIRENATPTRPAIRPSSAYSGYSIR